MKAWRWYASPGACVGRIFFCGGGAEGVGDAVGRRMRNSLSMWRPSVFNDSMGSGDGVKSTFSFVMRFRRYFDGPFSDGTRENIVGNRFGR